MTMARYLNGPRTAVQYLPASSYSAGDVVVVGGLALVADLDNPINAQDGIRQGALYVGGVYAMTADVAMAPGTRVHWDPTASKVTTAAAANTVPFGVTVGGASYLLSDAASTAVAVMHDPGNGPAVLYTQVAASTAVANTTVETLFDKSATIPASTLQPGDVIHVRAQGIATATNSTDTLTAKLYVGGLAGTLVVTTGALDVANNDTFLIDAEIVVRTNGATGTIVAAGIDCIGPAGTTLKSFSLASTAIDTTAAQVVGVSATWSAASAGDSCRLDVLDVDVRRK